MSKEDNDWTDSIANNQILSHNIDFYRNYFKGRVKDDWTLEDAVINEINFHKKRRENHFSAGFGNRVRYAIHCIRTIERYIIEEEITIPTETPKLQTLINDPLKDKLLVKEKISNDIDELIKMMHVTGWEKVFWSQEDFESYKKVIIEFFSNQNYKIPETKIKIKPKSKTNIIGIFKILRDKHSLSAGHMKEDTKLFELVKILDKWSNSSNYQIYKSITRDYLI